MFWLCCREGNLCFTNTCLVLTEFNNIRENLRKPCPIWHQQALHLCISCSYEIIRNLQSVHSVTAAAQIAYQSKFTTFPTKLIKYLLNLIEIYMHIGYWLGQCQCQTLVGVLVLRSCGTSQRIQYYLKVNLVNFWLFWYFLCIFPIKFMIASTLTPNTTTELPLIRKL